MKICRSLSKKCIAAAMSGVMLTSVCAVGFTSAFIADAAANLISNSTFDGGTSGWGMYKESGGSAELSTSNNRLALNVSSVGKLTYSVQAFYDIIPLYKNGVYHLKYDISSSVNRKVEGMIQQNGGTYQAYTWKGLDLTSTPQTVDYTFTMEADTDIMAKLVFNCGNEGEDLPQHSIYIDNVVLELVDDSNVKYTSSTETEPSIITNQVGYKTASKKVATFRKVTNESEFSVVNADTGSVAYTGKLDGPKQNPSANENDYLGDFSSVTAPGNYYIKCGNLEKSYTFSISDNVYDDLLKDSVRMLYLQRCGCSIADSEFDHAACHTGKAVVYGTSQTIDVSGGWHDAGDYGRYVVPGAKAVADILYAYDANPKLYGDNTNIPESGNGVPDVLDEARYELEWMLKMQADNGGVHHKVTCASFPGYVLPEKETDQLIVTPVSSTATADFCASMAMAYEFYNKIDSNFAKTCLNAATKAWTYLENNPNFQFTNPSDITTGEYGDKSDTDERYWAAAQLYRATGETKYLTAVNQISTKTGLDWATVGDYGNIALLTMDNVDKSSSAYTKAKSAVVAEADTFASNTSSSPYGVALTKFDWGSNMTVANAGIILGLAYDLTSNSKYIDSAESNLNYLLGKNPNATCFVSGYGTVSPKHPHHRPSMAKNKAMKGMLAGGVNSNLEDSAAKAYLASAPSAKCYIDNSESYSTNEICIYWNSPLTYLLSLTDKTSGGQPSTDPTSTNPTTSSTVLLGDVNLDGKIDISDVVKLRRFLSDNSRFPLSAQALANSDVSVNKDGINAQDAVAIQQFILGMTSGFNA